MNVLGEGGLKIAAQVHSHPQEAFHSSADDTWAIVRHEGALSLVVPYFAQRTTDTSFLADQKTYRLDALNRWTNIPSPELDRWLQVR